MSISERVSTSCIEESFSVRRDRKAAVSKRGMVATAFPEATAAGVSMLKKGGNAVDSTCAAALALGVCEPQASGLGGQSTALLYVDRRMVAIDGSSRAPSMTHASLLKEGSALLTGYRAATVPSTVAALGYMAERYGQLDWQTIIAPAIRIARRGYRITPLQNKAQAANMDELLSVGSGAAYFLKDGQVPYEPGDLFVQEDLADTLTHLADFGYGSFYHGAMADRIDSDMRKNGGLLRKDDLAQMPTPVERTPISREYRGLHIYTIPPPGAGDTMLLVMMLLGNIHRRHLIAKSPEAYHYIAEAFRKALLYRTQRPFDPNTYHQIQNSIHLSPKFAKQLSASIRNTVDPALPSGGGVEDIEDTTHLSVMDSEGNAVSLTQSIELVYGSKAAAGGMGFLYNNYMSAFDTKRSSHPFFLRPNAVPWSSVCPSMVFDGKEPWIALGSPGSSRIFSTVSLFLSRLLDEGNSMYVAMERPRMHCSLNGTISLEKDDSADALARHLKAKGYTIDIRERYSFYLGAIHAVLRCRTRPGFQGVAEVRRDGTAAGP
ncbi:MAG: gamma-glutamyltransferase [Nitrosopumilaceae archaeon]|nr:gamma-glutamyltransferase [Nitrosopumilaceae archaeon]